MALIEGSPDSRSIVRVDAGQEGTGVLGEGFAGQAAQLERPVAAVRYMERTVGTLAKACETTWKDTGQVRQHL